MVRTTTSASYIPILSFPRWRPSFLFFFGWLEANSYKFYSHPHSQQKNNKDELSGERAQPRHTKAHTAFILAGSSLGSVVLSRCTHERSSYIATGCWCCAWGPIPLWGSLFCFFLVNSRQKFKLLYACTVNKKTIKTSSKIFNTCQYSNMPCALFFRILAILQGYGHRTVRPDQFRRFHCFLFDRLFVL